MRNFIKYFFDLLIKYQSKLFNLLLKFKWIYVLNLFRFVMNYFKGFNFTFFNIIKKIFKIFTFLSIFSSISIITNNIIKYAY